MEATKDKIADLAEHAEELVETYYRLAMLNVTQKAANIVSAGITMLVVCTAGIFVLFFGGFALSWWLGNIIDSRAGGFLLGAAFFLVVMIVILLTRKKIIFPFIRDLLIRKLYD
jgi:hypothetical protein